MNLIPVIINNDKFFLITNITGSLNDASIFNATGFAQELEAERYPLPQPKPLKGETDKIPYFFIGDEAFGLSSYIMRPYSRRCLKSYLEKIFNYR